LPSSAAPSETAPEVSLVIPVRNEADNVLPLLEEIVAAARGWPWTWELIFVDDGSADATWERLGEARRSEPRVRALRLDRPHGQSAGVIAGLRAARAPICVTMDGDGQNDPADIARLVEAMAEADLVIGWRRERADTAWRRFQSRVANAFRDFFTGDGVHDIGCALKAVDRELALRLPAFDGLHRFLPTLFRYNGWRVREVPVSDRRRLRGHTKYGMWNRAFRGLRDIIGVRWIGSRMVRYEIREENSDG